MLSVCLTNPPIQPQTVDADGDMLFVPQTNAQGVHRRGGPGPVAPEQHAADAGAGARNAASPDALQPADARLRAAGRVGLAQLRHELSHGVAEDHRQDVYGRAAAAQRTAPGQQQQPGGEDQTRQG